MASETNFGTDKYKGAQINKLKHIQHLSDTIIGEGHAIELNPSSCTTNPMIEMRSILIADHDSARRQIISNTFCHYNIIECNNAGDAWKIATLAIPQLIIINELMLGINDLQLYQNLNQEPQTCGIPLIVLMSQLPDTSAAEQKECPIHKFNLSALNILEMQQLVESIMSRNPAITPKLPSTKIYPHQVTPEANNADMEFLTELTRIIESELTESQLTVDHLIKKTKLSRSALYSRIKQLTGMSANNYVKKLRIKMAMSLLKTNKYNVNEVAEMVGYRDRRYFSREFARITGQLPSEYSKL